MPLSRRAAPKGAVLCTVKFIIRDRQTGTVIEEADTFGDAKRKVTEYEDEDRKNGEYTDDYYEVVTEE